jgi:hypothetical protein
MVYVTVPKAEVKDVNVCAICVPVSDEDPTVLFEVSVQLKLVPITLLDKEIAVVVPEQIDCPKAGFIIKVGIGFTFIETKIVAPGHPLTLGVIAYTASPEVFPTVDSNWVMAFPVPADAPVTLV